MSVTTSFIAVYLTFRRSPYFALAYAANDMVLILLWTLATMENISYLSVIICFVMFLVNDLYGFVSWKRMENGSFALAEINWAILFLDILSWFVIIESLIGGLVIAITKLDKMSGVARFLSSFDF